MNLLIIFIGLSIVNVIFSTIKSIVTIKGGAFTASLISALYYGYYNIVLIYTVADFPLWQKVLITFVCNLVGVFIVKWGEAKARKDKMWLVKITVPSFRADTTKKLLKQANLSFTYYDLEKYYVFDIFCETQKDTATAIEICSICEGKAFATESKLSL